MDFTCPKPVVDALIARAQHGIYGYTIPTPAFHRSVVRWMQRRRLKPMVKLSKTIKSYLWGILNAIKHQVTNATSEAINGRIQWIKKKACGYRNRARFREAILFHLGGLDLMPKCHFLTHSKS